MPRKKGRGGGGRGRGRGQPPQGQPPQKQSALTVPDPAQRKAEEERRRIEDEKRRIEESERAEREREQEARERAKAEELRKAREDEEKERKKRLEEERKKAAAEVQKQKLQAAARQETLKFEAQRQAQQEQVRKQTEEVERNQRDHQRQVREMQDRIVREKEEALRLIEQERLKRERIEMLRKEFEEGKPNPVVRAKRLPPPVKTPNRPAQRRKLGDLPSTITFRPEDDVDEAVVAEYENRNLPSENLPKVPFAKRNGVYWLGQRRCEVVVTDGQVMVTVGPGRRQNFSTWIEQAEKVEALKLKALGSAQTMLYFQTVN